jgi:hypothetical protein
MKRPYYLSFRCCSTETNKEGIIAECAAHDISAVVTSAIFKLLKDGAVRVQVDLAEQSVIVAKNA